MSWNKLLVRAWILVCCAGVICIVWPEKPREPLVSAAGGWAVSEGFFPNGEPDGRDLPKGLSTHPDQTFWRSWSPNTQSTSGRLKSAVFKTNALALALPLVGYPAAPGNLVRLNNEATGEHLEVDYGNAHETWTEAVVPLPRAWRNAPLTVEAMSAGLVYVGIAAPAPVGRATLWKRSLFAAGAWHELAIFSLVLTTSSLRRLLARFDRRLGPGGRWVFLPLAATLLGYAVFFIYPSAPVLTISAVGILGLLGLRSHRREIARLWREPVSVARKRPAVVAWTVVSLLSWLVLNGQQTVSVSFLANYRFTPASWSTDNQLPLWVSAAVREGDARRAASKMGAWLVSDRPPAYSGLLVPARSATSPIFSAQGSSRLFPWAANALGVAVMSTWILPAWACLARGRVSGRRRLWVILLIALGPFAFFNTVYVWPKLLSAALALTAWLLLCPRGKTKWAAGAGAGLAFGAAIVSHGGIFFSHLAMALWLGVTQLRRRWACYLACGIAFFAVALPRQVWVRHHAPPGNALMKSAFAGTFGFGEQNISLVDTVVRAYRADTWEAWRDRKIQAVGTWVGVHQPIVGSHLGWDDGGLPARRWQLFNLLPALGPLLLFLPGLLRRKGNDDGHFSPRAFVGAGLLGLSLQLLLSWEAFVLHATSYGAVLMLHLGFAHAGLRLAKPVRVITTLLVTLNFLVVWLAEPASAFGHLDMPTFAAALVLGLFVAVWAVRLTLTPEIDGAKILPTTSAA